MNSLYKEKEKNTIKGKGVGLFVRREAGLFVKNSALTSKMLGLTCISKVCTSSCFFFFLNGDECLSIDCGLFFAQFS